MIADKFNQPALSQSDKLRLITYKVYEHRLRDVWSLFRDTPVEPILIKGWAAARNYPQPYQRRIGDFDLAAAPADFEAAVRLTKGQKHGDIDWHRGLRHLDTLDWDDLFENSILINCEQTAVRVLRPEDHLRVLCVHWLGDGGRDREKLFDIYYAVENRPADFDWDRCLNVVDEKRRRWIVCTLALARKYLDLNLTDTPVAEESRAIPDWIVKTVEKEWNSPVEFRYLLSCLHDGRELFKQLKKRFPPNAIQATVETDGDFDDGARIFYQVKNIFTRTLPSIKRIIKSRK